jgi:ParB family chromosome partitioning protein
MNAKKKTPQSSGLGELSDLSSLLDTPAPGGSNRPVELPVDMIDEDPNQPRTADNPGFSDESIAELAATIKSRGVKSPISVRDNGGRYTINHGARRYRAVKVAGLSAIPAFVDNDYNEADQVVENLQRNNLTPREIADFIGRELARGKKKVQIAESIGKSPAYVTQHITLLDLPEPVALAFNNGRVTDVTLVNELAALHKKMPEQVAAWLADDSLELTRRTLKELSRGTLKKLEQKEESAPEDEMSGMENEEGIQFEEDAISLEDAKESEQEEREDTTQNPFLCYFNDGVETHQAENISAEDRIDAVRKFNAAECEAALVLPDLQKTVKTAIERRIRELGKENVDDVTPEEKQESSKEHEGKGALQAAEQLVISIKVSYDQASALAEFCNDNEHAAGYTGRWGRKNLQTALKALREAIRHGRIQ